ncbi:regulator of chromosome condensation 1/beta-lactamase-inhibitor protein II [Gymnopilus junonius]|uniref:Regulator of chromosome condensation 1/beta-lactamase-inhibitor protein II n=1 Tax=Gymnopilus junonius TaxID=109634 RepID=A0A9P5NG44_GYMJU|nr:regulator of chromosome condensation 1/beta-lactamase-inhibitor protein II [Gymnopilus junonius]
MLVLLSAGSNAQGQLGNSTLEDSHSFQTCSFVGLPPHTLPSGTKHVVGFAAGANHTLILLETENRDKTLWGVGDGRKGQLGLKYKKDTRDGRLPLLFRRIELSLEDAGLGGYFYKSIAATWETSYAVLSCTGKSDVVISFGSDDFGDLGIGGLKGKQPAKDFHVISFGHISPSEDVSVLSLSSGQRHVIAQLQFGSTLLLVGWGTSRHGQLGRPHDTPFSTLPQVISVGPGPNDQDQTVCALGIHHSVLLQGCSQLLGLGSDRKSQLQVLNALSAQSQVIQQIDCTWNGTYIVIDGEDKWKVHSSGNNSHSQLGWTTAGGSHMGTVEFPDQQVSNTSVAIACGSEHVLALIKPSLDSQLQGAQVWGWGWNEHGNLGLGNTEDVPTPVKLWPRDADVVDIHSVWAGSGTSWILAEVAGH